VTAWPEPVERVASYIREARAEARIEEFRTRTPTATDAARAIGCELAQIVKSLVFDCDGQPAVVLVPGDRRADAGKVAMLVGAASARVASPAYVEAATGFAPGAVAPFPLPRVDRVLMEQTLLAHQLVWIGAGSPTHMAGIAPAELMRLARARPVDAIQNPT
jgi:prolyl-tRNA editing enzyme YbaK/EbsC (Cys-tRNA(Pro) deacylase)